MKQLSSRILPFGLLAVLWSGCGVDTESIEREGYKPVYVSKENAGRIASLPAQPLRQTGKIYSKDTLVFVNELNKGIHVINNKDPRNPQNIAFISIPGNVDIAIKGNILYADNFRDLVALNISNPRNVTLAKRVADALPQNLQPYPPQRNVYFECVDESRGYVVGWEKVTLKDPKCRR
ncbi:MAG: hypothetical protein MUD08_02235 [Cytophagales bacterium]|jgi:hypothetical protein|nr:hypothetical protein [Cytophagales bacterium]